MKRYIAALLALVMCLSLSACGADPLAEEYASVDEVVAALAEHFDNPEKQYKTIQSNPSICQYFHKDHLNDEIWKKLKEVSGEDGSSVFLMSDIHYLYNICNQTNGFDDWFEFLNVGSDGADEPFIMWGDSGMTKSKLTESIQDKFKDPDSVSIENAWVCFELPEGVDASEGFDVYEENCRYVIYAAVRANNGFGAADASVCKIEGHISWSGWTFSVKETGTYVSLNTRPVTDIDGYGAWSRIF